MGFSIRVAESRKYIVCRVLGPFTVDYARTFTIELDRISRAEKIKRFLTDVRYVFNNSSTTENYRFAYEDMPRLDLQRDVRAATLASPGDRSHDFIKTVAQNAGYNVQLFFDEAAAVAWLCED